MHPAVSIFVVKFNYLVLLNKLFIAFYLGATGDNLSL
jgi:hypothetical protein